MEPNEEVTPVEEVHEEVVETAPSTFGIPTEYKDKAWASQIHSIEDAFKKIDNQEKYISKGQLPHRDSSESDLASFSDKMKKYTSDIDYSDLVGQDVELGKALKESGVPKFQAKAVVDLIKGRESKEYGAEEFDKILNDKFKGRENDLSMAKSVLKELGEDKTKSLLSKRNDIVADVMDIIAEVGKKYEVKSATTMAKLAESPMGSQPVKSLDWDDKETRIAFMKELDAWRANPHSTDEQYHNIMRKYKRID